MSFIFKERMLIYYGGHKIKRQNKKDLINTELTTNSILSLN